MTSLAFEFAYTWRLLCSSFLAMPFLLGGIIQCPKKELHRSLQVGVFDTSVLKLLHMSSLEECSALPGSQGRVAKTDVLWEFGGLTSGSRSLNSRVVCIYGSEGIDVPRLLLA